MIDPTVVLSPANPLILAQALVLLGWWAPIVMVALFLGWAWVVSTIYDKDAAEHYLPRQQWNALHAVMGGAALLVVLISPLPGFITLPVVAAILMTDLAVYFTSRNNDERIGQDHKWSLSIAAILAARGKDKEKTVKGASRMELVGPDREPIPAPDKNTPEFEVRVTAEEFIQRVADERGSQLDISPARDGSYVFSTLVDGVRQPVEQVAAKDALAIINVYKTIAGLDVSDRRRKQVGQFKMGPINVGATTPVKVTTLGDARGIRLSLLFDPEGQVQRRLDDLGLLSAQREDIAALVAEQHGAVLVVSPPDGGRTSTLYALVRDSDAYLNNIQMIELEPQAEIEGVRTNVFDPAAEGGEFSTTVRSILRRDPNVVAIAEMPDEDTAKVVAKTDHDRMRVYLSFNCDNAFAALQVYAKAVGDQKLAALSVHGVIAQRLARRLCENCRVQFQPTPVMLKKLGLPPDTKQLFRKSGQVLVKDKPETCSACGGAGFFGQVGIFEVFPLGQPERDLLAINDLSGLKALLRKAKRPGIQTAALQHAILGNTSIEEVVRITAKPKKRSSTTKSRPAPQPKAPA